MELIILNDGLYQLIPVTKANPGWNICLYKRTSKLHGDVRDTKTKTNRLR
jgi:hypothetical protein